MTFELGHPVRIAKGCFAGLNGYTVSESFPLDGHTAYEIVLTSSPFHGVASVFFDCDIIDGLLEELGRL